MFCLGLFGRIDWIQPVDSKETVDRDKTASAARNWTNIAPQTDATTFALPSVSILLLWLWPSRTHAYMAVLVHCVKPWLLGGSTCYWAPPLSNANNTNLSDFSFAIFVIPLFCLGLCTFVLPLWPENSVIYHTVRATFSDLIKKNSAVSDVAQYGDYIICLFTNIRFTVYVIVVW